MKSIWITGATGGIGHAVARRLHGPDSRLCLLGRDRDRLSATADSLSGGDRPEALLADLGAPEDLAVALRGRLPSRLDVLVHCAGTVRLGALDSTDPAVWSHTLAVNLTGPAELTRLLLPALRVARGHIVMVNSTAGLVANPRWGAYAASKFGLRALADSLRAEESDHGVRVTSVYPGRTATPMQERVRQMEGLPYVAHEWASPDSVATAVATAVDLPRDAELTDLTVRPGPRVAESASPRHPTPEHTPGTPPE